MLRQAQGGPSARQVTAGRAPARVLKPPSLTTGCRPPTSGHWPLATDPW